MQHLLEFPEGLRLKVLKSYLRVHFNRCSSKGKLIMDIILRSWLLLSRIIFS